MCSRFDARPASSLVNTLLQKRHRKGDALKLCSPSFAKSTSSSLLLLSSLLLFVDVPLASFVLSVGLLNTSKGIGGNDAMRRLRL